MNILDSLINYVSPRAGRDRAKARIQTAALMNYDAASTGRRTYGWKSPNGSADRAGQPGRTQMRNLSRDMIRNRPYAARASEVVVGATVGTGIAYAVHGKALSDASKSFIEDVLADHLETTKIDAYRDHDIYGLQEIAMKAVFSDGEVLVRRRWRDPKYEPDLRLPFQIELLEVDFLDNTIMSNGKNEVREGIEYGPTGQAVAYWLYPRHPGDARIVQTQSVRVSASEIIHIRVADRPGQMRGVPWLAPVMMTLGELSDYCEALILKQRMAAMFAAIIERESDLDSGAPDLTELAALAPGAMVNAPAGTKVNFTSPPSVDGYGEFVKVGLRQVATGIGITYEALSGDLENVNYSSGRMGHMVMDRNVETWQSALMISQFCNGIERWIKDAWLYVPSLPRLGFSLDWTPPRRPLIDPTKEIPAMIAEVEGGLSSMQRQQRRLGYDPDTIRRERAEDMAKDAEAGLPSALGGVAAALAAGANQPDKTGAIQ